MVLNGTYTGRLSSLLPAWTNTPPNASARAWTRLERVRSSSLGGLIELTYVRCMIDLQAGDLQIDTAPLLEHQISSQTDQDSKSDRIDHQVRLQAT